MIRYLYSEIVLILITRNGSRVPLTRDSDESSLLQPLNLYCKSFYGS